MPQEDLAKLSTAELEQKLRSGQAVQRTTIVIFGIIILAWLLLGFWRSNTPVFIITLVMALGTAAVVSAGPRSIAQELRRRRGESPD